MPPEDRVRWEHMIDAATHALRFMEGRSQQDLENDQMLQFAVIRAIEVIGEAASRVSRETQAAHVAIPWPAIIGMRNRLVHAYFQIDNAVLWVAVSREIPRLLDQLVEARDWP